MDDISNWEFAAAVAAVAVGLGGLVLLTIIGAVGSWRVFERASRAATEAANAAAATKELARQLSLREGTQASGIADVAGHLSELCSEAGALLRQQAQLEDALRQFIDAGVLPGRSEAAVDELDGAVARLEENLARIAAAVADLGKR